MAEDRKRQDGKGASDGVTNFNLGVDHPYAVKSDLTPSLLPEGAIAVRLHSIGGWGMITTGKNLSEIIGEFGDYVAERDNAVDEFGDRKEVLHVSANPKYGSEKKGAPTSYFLTVAPERIRTNCDLHHVDAVLCCDPKAFLHCNPVEGINEGGAFVWESDVSPEEAWKRIPQKYRQEIIDKKIRLFTLDGFKIAREATNRPDLQLRMQGNAFLGAFFKVSSFLADNAINTEHFHEVVRAQYVKKFGRFGDAGRGLQHGSHEPGLRLRGRSAARRRGRGRRLAHARRAAASLERRELRNLRRREGRLRRLPGADLLDGALRQRVPRGPGLPPACVPAGVGGAWSPPARALRRPSACRAARPPVFIAENCTQCMECVAVCPDTAMPNTAQDIDVVLDAAIRNYVSDIKQRDLLLSKISDIEAGCRAKMLEEVKAKSATPFKDVVREIVGAMSDVDDAAKSELYGIVDILPMAYTKVNAIFGSREKKNPGAGGVFSIFINDLCKGCGECVHECGDKGALRMEPENEALSTQYAGAQAFFDLLPENAPAVPGPLRQREPGGLQARRAAEPLHGPQQLRSPRVRRRAPAPAAAKRPCSTPWTRSPRPSCGRSSTPRRTGSTTRPNASPAKAPPNSPGCSPIRPRITASSAGRSRT